MNLPAEALGGMDSEPSTGQQGSSPSPQSDCDAYTPSVSRSSQSTAHQLRACYPANRASITYKPPAICLLPLVMGKPGRYADVAGCGNTSLRRGGALTTGEWYRVQGSGGALSVSGSGLGLGIRAIRRKKRHTASLPGRVAQAECNASVCNCKCAVATSAHCRLDDTQGLSK